MITQFKLYIYGGLAVLIVGMAIAVNVLLTKLKLETERANRNEENTSQLLKEKDARITTLELTQKQYMASMDSRVDSILDELKTNPRHVVEQTTINNNYYDTTTTVITPKPEGSGDSLRYPFEVKEKCISLKGYMIVKDDVPTLVLQERGFTNTIDIFVVWERKKILGLKIGKKEYSTKASSECGDVKVRKIDVVKGSNERL
jgi:hypothetical protein